MPPADTGPGRQIDFVWTKVRLKKSWTVQVSDQVGKAGVHESRCKLVLGRPRADSGPDWGGGVNRVLTRLD